MGLTKLVLFGGGGHCLSCIDVIESTGKYEVLGICDKRENIGKKVGAYEINFTDESIEKIALDPDVRFLVCIGQVPGSLVRERIIRRIDDCGGRFATVISPLAYISPKAEVGEGTVVMHHALINVGASIGRNSIINSKALIEHEALVGNNCHVSTGAIINGKARVGDNSFLGSNSVVIDGVSVPKNYFLKANERFVRP